MAQAARILPCSLPPIRRLPPRSQAFSGPKPLHGRFLEEQEAPVDVIEHVKGGYRGNGERMTPDDISSVLDVMEELL
jgi:hypothetical protein